MEQYKEEFIEFMVDCQVLKFGAFVTKSGRNTPFFVNTGFYRTGEQLRGWAATMRKRSHPNTAPTSTYCSDRPTRESR